MAPRTSGHGFSKTCSTSGMNKIACLGMWGNWKMPVGYKYMPELRSDAPEAYDESSGAKFTSLISIANKGCA